MTSACGRGPAKSGSRAERPREQGVGGDVLDEVVGGEQDRARLIEEHRVRRAVAGAVQHPQRAVAQAQLRAVARAAASPRPREPHARKLAETARSAVTTSAGMPWRSISRSANRSSSSVCSPKLARNGARRSSAATSAPERRARIEARPKWSMCWWLTIEQLDVLDRVAERGERLLELVERLGGVRARSRAASAASPRSGRR